MDKLVIEEELQFEHHHDLPRIEKLKKEAKNR